MSIKQYIADNDVLSSSGADRHKHIQGIFNQFLNQNPQHKSAYTSADPDGQAKIYGEIEPLLQEKYPEVFTVTVKPAKPMRIKTRHGSVLEGRAAQSYMEKSGRWRGFTEVLQEPEEAITRPLLDEHSEYIVNAIRDGLITPDDLDDNMRASALPVIRAAAPERADAFMRREREWLKQQGVGPNSFLLKNTIRGASPSDKLTTGLDALFGRDDADIETYNRWKQAYPTRAGVSDTVGVVAGLASSGHRAASVLAGGMRPGAMKTVAKLIGYMGADAAYAGKLPGFASDYLELEPGSSGSRALTAIEGVLLAGALDLPLSMAQTLRGKPIAVVAKDLNLTPEQIVQAASKLDERAKGAGLTGSRSTVEAAAPKSPIAESYIRAREELQDPYFRARKLIEQLDGVEDSENFYQAVRVEAGKTQFKISGVNEQVKGALEGMAQADDALKLKPDTMQTTVSDYLAARHAPDFNRHTRDALQERLKKLDKAGIKDPNARKEAARIRKERAFVLEGKGSGISDSEALRHVQEIEGSDIFPEIKKHVDTVDSIHRQTLDVLEEGGLIAPEVKASLRESMPHHVPFQRVLDDVDFDEFMQGTGLDMGRDITGTGLRKAEGSTRQINNVIENVYANLRGAIERAERNKSNLRALNLARKFDPDNQLFEIRSAKGGTPSNALSIYENGKKVNLVIKDEQLAKAFKYVPSAAKEWYIRFGLATNRLLGRVYTGWNPDFMVPNKVRDLMDGMANSIRETGSLKSPVRMAKSALGDSTAIVDYMRGMDTPGAREYRELVEQGGSTGGLAHMTLGSFEQSFQSLSRQSKGGLSEFGAQLNRGIDNINMIFEDSTRLGAYRAAKAAGKTKEQAARIARDISFDPLLRGRSGDAASSAFLFFNPGIQSIRNMAKTMTKPKAAIGAASTLWATQYSIDMWNRAITGNPEYMKELDGYGSKKSIPIIWSVNNDPTAETKYQYTPIPVGYGLLPVKAIGDSLVKLMHGDIVDPKQAAMEVGASVFDGFNPLGGGDIVAAITPTNLAGVPVEPFVEMARNQSGLGNSIRPPHEEMKNLYDHGTYYDYTARTPEGQAAIRMAGELYNRFRVDVSPENIQHLYETFTGGTGKTIQNAAIAASALFNGEDLDPTRIPVIRRFYRPVTREAADSRAGNDARLGQLAKEERTRVALLQKTARNFVRDVAAIPRTQWEPFVEQLPVEYRKSPEFWGYTMRQMVAFNSKIANESKVIKNNFGVENGARAQFYVNYMADMSAREKQEFLAREAKAGNINKTVVSQITEILATQGE